MHMEDTAYRAIAIVGAGAVLPNAANVNAFWENVKRGRYCISEVTPDRWDPAFYYDADPKAPDKTYSKIGGWVREFTWDPMKWRMPLPPRVTGVGCEAETSACFVGAFSTPVRSSRWYFWNARMPSLVVGPSRPSSAPASR